MEIDRAIFELAEVWAKEEMREIPADILLQLLRQKMNFEPGIEIQEKFYHYLDNCLNPSHLFVQQLLDLNLVDKAIKTTEELKNRIEKTKALELLISYFLAHQQIERSLPFLEQLPDKKPYAEKIAHAWVMENQQEKAIRFAESLSNSEERDTLLREIARMLTEQNALETAFSVLEKIANQEINSHAKSNLVYILTSQKQFQKAKELALTIQDRDYREDAILDIVKAYLKVRYVDEAILFVEGINPDEKSKPAKVIAVALKVAHQDEKVRRVREIFSLPEQIRNVA